jgi:hypothetical protein
MPTEKPAQPANYNSKTHFLQVAGKTLNKEIRDYFDPGGEFPDDDITTPTGALKRACLIDADDSLLLANSKMIFYGLMTGKLTDDIGKQFYGVPKTAFKEVFRSLDAQLIFYFKESRQDAKRMLRTRNPLDMRLSWRLLTKAEQLTQSDITGLQNRIVSNFPANYHHPKGLTKFAYNDPRNGFSGTNCLAINKAEAVDLYRGMCAIAQVQYDDGNLTKSSRDSYITETDIVLGNSTKKTNKPRTGRVYLQKVTLVLPNNNDRELVTRVGDKIVKNAFDYQQS